MLAYVTARIDKNIDVDMAKKIIDLITDEDRCSQMAYAGFNRAIESFSLEAMAENTQELLHSSL